MIDIGVNLTNGQFHGKVERVLVGAKQAGIEHVVITGTDLESSREAIGLCEQYQSAAYPALTCTAGVHPHDASTWNQGVANHIRELHQHPSVVSVGETGLDFNRNYSSPEEQEATFRAQIEIACELQKPLFLHERDAFGKQTEILDSYQSDLPKAIAHCFTGSREQMEGYLERGFYIGITGWVCDERRGKDLANIVSGIPLDRLMIETDAPFLLPRNIEPKPESRTNYPHYLPWIVKKLAECYRVDEEVISAKTTKNSFCFFNLD